MSALLRSRRSLDGLDLNALSLYAPSTLDPSNFDRDSLLASTVAYQATDQWNLSTLSFPQALEKLGFVDRVGSARRGGPFVDVSKADPDLEAASDPVSLVVPEAGIIEINGPGTQSVTF